MGFFVSLYVGSQRNPPQMGLQDQILQFFPLDHPDPLIQGPEYSQYDMLYLFQRES